MTALIIAVVVLVLALIAAWLLTASEYTPPVTADEVHMVTTPDLWKIRLTRHKAKCGPGEPVFLCHGFMSNQFNFALPAGESMADWLAERGYDCWLIDLRGARSSVPPFGHTLNDPSMDDHLLRDIPAAINFIRQETGFEQVHWIGHSMGGMLLYAYDATWGADLLASGTTLGSPIGFEGVPFRRPTVLIVARRLSWRLFRCLQRLLVTFLTTFKPKSDLVPINWKNLSPKLDAKALYGMTEAPPLLVAESLASAAEQHRWLVNDFKVDVFANLKHLHVPLFAIFGSADTFVAVHTIEVFFNEIPNPDKKLLILSVENGHAADYSHVDLVMGSETPHEVYEPILAWLEAHPVREKLDVPEAEGDGVSGEPAAVPDTSAEHLIEQPVVVAGLVLEDPVTARRVVPGKKASAAKKKAPIKKPTAKKAAAAPKKAPAKKPAAKKAVAAPKEPPAKKPAARKRPAK